MTSFTCLHVVCLFEFCELFQADLQPHNKSLVPSLAPLNSELICLIAALKIRKKIRGLRRVITEIEKKL